LIYIVQSVSCILDSSSPASCRLAKPPVPIKLPTGCAQDICSTRGDVLASAAHCQASPVTVRPLFFVNNKFRGSSPTKIPKQSYLFPSSCCGQFAGHGPVHFNPIVAW